MIQQEQKRKIDAKLHIKTQNKRKVFSVSFAFLFSVSFALMFPVFGHAASLYFTVPKDVVFVGEDFDVTLMLDTEGEAVNTVGGEIRLPKDIFFLKSTHTGDSIIDLWIEGPREEGGAIVFSGIIPGGFQGIRSPFSSVFSPGKVLTLALRARAPGTAVFSLDGVTVLAHDGAGTPIAVSSRKGTIAVEKAGDEEPAFAGASAGKQETGDKEQETRDMTPPERFEITITRDPSLYDNQWTAIFATQDKESGVGYYELYESGKEYGIEEIAAMGGIPWERAQSPYLLKNQGETHHVYIKAVDNAGNIRISHAGSSVSLLPVDKKVSLLFALGIITILLLAVFFRKKYYTKTR
ncbi:MAG: hypothetical protein HYY92_02970 [Parcubacteria group bacterium]|nr:hypothetical protein [Parcubacteria group bacterium]